MAIIVIIPRDEVVLMTPIHPATANHRAYGDYAATLMAAIITKCAFAVMRCSQRVEVYPDVGDCSALGARSLTSVIDADQ